MGGFLAQPITTKTSDQGKGLGLRYGLSSMQGWRPEMEDAHDTQLGLDYGLHDWSFFAVFDGHAGKHTSCYASSHLLDHILGDQEFKLNRSNHEGKKSTETASDDQKNTSSQKDITTSQKLDVEQTETEKSKSSTTNQAHPDDQNDEAKFDSFPLTKQVEMVKRAIKSGFLRIDQTMRQDRKDMSGSTAICAFISPTHLFIANCGDSRAVLYDGIVPKFATEDHKPLNPTERTRIINAGGTATERVNGTLAVSRSLGDFEFKKNELRGPCEQLVSPEPEITVIERQSNDKFLILACDGIWDVMSNDELCEFVEYNLQIESNLETVCSNVLDVCLRRGSRDNMSIIIVVFENGPEVDSKMVELAKKNDRILLGMLDQIQDEDPQQTFLTALAVLEDQVLSCAVNRLYLAPPGAGLRARYDMLRERFESRMTPAPGEVTQEQNKSVAE